MRGIIVKPTPCCKSTRSIGEIVQAIGELKNIEADCSYCKKTFKEDFVTLKEGDVIQPYRVKWFNDDLDKQIQEEDTIEQIKEKEGV